MSVNMIAARRRASVVGVCDGSPGMGAIMRRAALCCQTLAKDDRDREEGRLLQKGGSLCLYL
jgi:hypothetical protein